jgi:hypothetical protein
MFLLYSGNSWLTGNAEAFSNFADLEKLFQPISEEPERTQKTAQSFSAALLYQGSDTAMPLTPAMGPAGKDGGLQSTPPTGTSEVSAGAKANPPVKVPTLLSRSFPQGEAGGDSHGYYASATAPQSNMVPPSGFRRLKRGRRGNPYLQGVYGGFFAPPPHKGLCDLERLREERQKLDVAQRSDTGPVAPPAPIAATTVPSEPKSVNDSRGSAANLLQANVSSDDLDANADILENFDFDAFLHTDTDGDFLAGFDFDAFLHTDSTTDQPQTSVNTSGTGSDVLHNAMSCTTAPSAHLRTSKVTIRKTCVTDRDTLDHFTHRLTARGIQASQGSASSPGRLEQERERELQKQKKLLEDFIDSQSLTYRWLVPSH